MRILLLDNIDSFTYNIFHYLEALGSAVSVIDNQSVQREDLDRFDALIISPGPGLPSSSGKLMNTLQAAIEREMPLLGVCLGMQAIAEQFGGTLYNQKEVKHGQGELLTHNGESLLFSGVPATFTAGLYHSWAVAETLPEQLIATAFSGGVMMALEHTSLPVYGVQYHPESILSEWGMEVFQNFIEIVTHTKRI